MDKTTEADFDRLSWHDCPIWGLEFRVGDPERGDWTSDLVLKIDYIVEWTCSSDRRAAFRIAPATVAFHGVADSRIKIDWGASEFQVAMHDLCVDRIVRERVSNQKVYLDRPYYSWAVHLNSPKGGEISFGAVGFTQTLLSEPVASDNSACPSPSVAGE